MTEPNQPELRNPGRRARLTPSPIPHEKHSGTDTQIHAERAVWRYCQQQKRDGERIYLSYVQHVETTVAEQVQRELATVIRALLDWAVQHHHQSAEERDAA